MEFHFAFLSLLGTGLVSPTSYHSFPYICKPQLSPQMGSGCKAVSKAMVLPSMHLHPVECTLHRPGEGLLREGLCMSGELLLASTWSFSFVSLLAPFKKMTWLVFIQVAPRDHPW